MSHPVQPVLFVSHGAPTLALEGGAWEIALRTWAGTLRGVRAILMVSAHWESPGAIRVMAAAHPETLHDFGGFPEALYRLRYPAPGAPELAARVVQRLQAGGLEASLDPERPLDHGAWVPLRAAFPEAEIPVLQVSLPVPRSPQLLFQLGQLLAPLRQEGVLLVGSGGIVHNLRLLDWSGGSAIAPWAQAFEGWISEGLEARDSARLFQAQALAPGYAQAVPTSEHFDPLYFSLGAGGAAAPRTLHEDWQYGSLSLRTWAWD